MTKIRSFKRPFESTLFPNFSHVVTDKILTFPGWARGDKTPVSGDSQGELSGWWSQLGLMRGQRLAPLLEHITPDTAGRVCGTCSRSVPSQAACEVEMFVMAVGQKSVLGREPLCCKCDLIGIGMLEIDSSTIIMCFVMVETCYTCTYIL